MVSLDRIYQKAKKQKIMTKKEYFLSKKDYDKGVSIMVRFCLDFVVARDHKILLSRRLIDPFKGFWHLPGGMVGKGEPIQEAAERILMSELGLKPVSIQLQGYIEYLDEKILGKGLSIHSVSMVFKTVLEKGTLKGSFQAEEMKFFSEIPNHTIPVVKTFLDKNWSALTE
jgi:8-oxo-dGTP diphosphatase